MSSGQTYNWEMTGAPDPNSWATDPQAAQSWNNFVAGGGGGPQAEIIAPPSYQEQVDMARSWGVPENQIASVVGTPEQVAQNNQAIAQQTLDLYGFVPTYAPQVGYSITPEQQAAAIKNTGINYDPNLAAHPIESKDYASAMVSAYQRILGRTPTLAEIQPQIAKLQKDPTAYKDIVTSIAKSPEAQKLVAAGVVGKSTIDTAPEQLSQGFGLYPDTSSDPLGGLGGALANFDKGVRNTVPGGWYTVGAVALAAATMGSSLGLSSTSQAAIAMDAAGMAGGGATASEIAGTLAANYGIGESAATTLATAATTTSAASSGATALGSQILSQMGLAPTVTNALISIGQGSLTGAGMGGITAAITGGSIGKGILNGAITGTVTAGVNMGMSGLAPITAGIGAGAAGGAVNAALTGGSLVNGALTGGVAGGVGNMLTGTQYANWAREAGGAAGGVVSSLLNGTNIVYGAVSGAALGGIGGMVASGVTSLTDPYLESAILGSRVNADGSTTFTADDGSTWTQDASGKVIGSTPAFETMSFDDGSTITFNPTSGEVVSATDWDGNVVKSQEVPDWLQNQFAPRMNNADITATTMAGTLAPKLSAQLQKIIGNFQNKTNTAPGQTGYSAISPVQWGTGPKLNFGQTNPDFLKPYDWNGFGTHEALAPFDPNAFTQMYMSQPKQAAWSQGAAPNTAQYVPVPFVPKTAADYAPNKIFGPSGQPGGQPLPQAPAVPAATPSGLVSNQTPQPLPSVAGLASPIVGANGGGIGPAWTWNDTTPANPINPINPADVIVPTTS